MKDDAGAVGGEGQPASGGHAEAVGADSKLAGGGRVDDIDWMTLTWSDASIQRKK